MSHECVFFDGQDGFKCNRVAAYPKLREALGCKVGDGDFIGLAQTMCKESTDEERLDCPAFVDILEFEGNSSYSKRLGR